MNMKTVTTVALSLGAPAALAESDKRVSVMRAGTHASTAGPSSNFTGAVRVDSRFAATAPAKVGGGTVTFEPSARTAWHTHPLGQILIVTAGVGFVQHWDGAVQEIRPGDIAWIPPGVKHWHGATETTGMSHIAISETLDGKSVEWMEHVTDEQYTR